MTNHRNTLFLVGIALAAALFGFVGGIAAPFTGIGQDATGKMVRAYLLDHPEVLPEAMERLHRKEMAERLDPLHKQVETAFPGAELGNPRGKTVLVEFSDYACGYCRQSVADVDALIAANPDLKVVIREYPILSPESAAAARMALAAAEQGRFAAFHKAMFAGGRPSAQSISAAATAAGLDMARAQTFAASTRVEAELALTVKLAEALGMNGTPSWVAGGQVLSGAVGADSLAEALAGTPAR